MTNDDLKRFYPLNATPEKNKDFVRYDENNNVAVGDNPGPKHAVNRDFVERELAAVEGGEIIMSILADETPIAQSQEGFIITYHNGGELLVPIKGSEHVILDISEDGQHIVARLDQDYVLQDTSFTIDGGMYVSSTIFPADTHVQLLFEIETEGTHSGADFVLHPYNSSICHTTFRLLVGGQYIDGFAYLDENNHARISFSQPIDLTDIIAHYKLVV